LNEISNRLGSRIDEVTQSSIRSENRADDFVSSQRIRKPPKSRSRRQRSSPKTRRWRPQRPRRLRFSFFKPDCQRTGAAVCETECLRDRKAAQPIDITLSAARGFPARPVDPFACRERQTTEANEVSPAAGRGGDIFTTFSPVNRRHETILHFPARPLPPSVEGR